MALTSRAFDGTRGDLRRMQRLVQDAWRAVGPKNERHVGDVAWAHTSVPGRHDTFRRRLSESYRDVRATWPYREDLDCVVEAPDGSFAAYALAWYDDENRVGELEPVGTHPDHRRMGIGRAVNLYALQRLREVGAKQAVVMCRGDDAYPIPKRLYESVGFRHHSRIANFGKTR